jgi:hypothetical protein
VRLLDLLVASGLALDTAGGTNKATVGAMPMLITRRRIWANAINDDAARRC